MRTPVVATAFVALLVACEPAPSQADKLTQLDAIVRSTKADLLRQQAECRAVAVEFNGDRQMVVNCIETYRLMVEMARHTIADVEKRRGEITGGVTPVTPGAFADLPQQPGPFDDLPARQ